ncbi:glycosyltransferase family 4 protein [Desulfosediminicola sp.]|uniref:glycosyltransferase family 4 protein n=1 Tax=Desulfosediminicola sp. TaxID=2886825 RepID=UPI003AF2FFC2
MIKIAIVPGFKDDTFSSIEKMYIGLDRYLKDKKLMKLVWVVEKVPGGKNPIFVQKLIENNGEVCFCSTGLFGKFLTLYKIFRTHKIDVVWTHFGAIRYFAQIVGKIAGCKTVLNVHGEYLAEWRKGQKIKQLLCKICIDNYIGVSEFVLKPFEVYGNTYLLHNAINLCGSEFINEEELNGFREQYGIPKNKQIITMVSAFRKEKRHRLMIEIFSKILSQYDNVLLFLAGDGETRSEIHELIKERDIAHSVIMSGHISNVNLLYAVSDILVLPSENEPFGMVLLEAMYNKLPVVASKSGGVPEFIVNGLEGLLIDKDNESSAFVSNLIGLLEQDKLRQEIGQNARKKVARSYNIDLWFEKQTKILEQITKN